MPTHQHHRSAPLTDAPTTPNAAHHLPPKVEWLRIAEATRTRGIGRSSLYEMITSGAIKSAVVKKRGNIRGIRLISADSLDAFIENCVVTPA